MYIDTIFFVLLVHSFFLFFKKYLSLLLSWMFEHDSLDTCCFGVLYAHVLYLHLFSAVEHVSHGKAL